jgi:DNA-binding Lrp family transcriptional regulator
VTSRSLTPAIVRQMDLPTPLRTVLLELLAMAHGRPAISTTQQELARRLGAGERSIRRHLSGLEGLGLIERHEVRSKYTGYKVPSRITFAVDAWAIIPSQPAKMAARTDRPNRPGWPVGQPARMAAIKGLSSEDGDRGDERTRREEDVDGTGAQRFEPVNDGATLRLIPGGRAA